MKPETRDFGTLARAATVTLAFLLASCASDPTADNIRFGESVRHMITLQTTDPQGEAPGLDGEKAENVLRAYRGDVAKPETVERQVIELDF